MSLTYQPFAQTPELNRLSRDLRMNVPDGERVASGLLSLGLTAAALARSGVSRWALLLGAGALFRRALIGQCPIYAHLKLDKRHLRPADPINRGA